MTLCTKARAFALLGAACLAACDSPSSFPSIKASSYDRSCSTVADCAAVFEGFASCCGFGCANTAVSQHALAAYMKDLAKADTAACEGTVCRAILQPSPPAPVPSCVGRVACHDGHCALDVPPADGATD